MPKTDATDLICQECWNRAVHAYGTGTLFLTRSRLYTRLLRALSFLGIVVPLLIGGVVLGFGIDARYLKQFIAAAAAAGVLQLVVSAWSLAYSWTENLQYSLESAAENFDLSIKFKELGQQAQFPPDDLAVLAAGLKARDDSRSMADAKKGVKDKELRRAHRAGLRQFGRECTSCKKVPLDLASTDCPICGSF